jgi:hypothetical protein
LMAVEALKQIVGLELDRGSLRLYDASTGAFNAITIRKRDKCPTCR